MRNMNNSNLEEPLIHLSIWIRNDAIMNEEGNKAEGSRRSLPTKQRGSSTHKKRREGGSN